MLAKLVPPVGTSSHPSDGASTTIGVLAGRHGRVWTSRRIRLGRSFKNGRVSSPRVPCPLRDPSASGEQRSSNSRRVYDGISTALSACRGGARRLSCAWCHVDRQIPSCRRGTCDAPRRARDSRSPRAGHGRKPAFPSRERGTARSSTFPFQGLGRRRTPPRGNGLWPTSSSRAPHSVPRARSRVADPPGDRPTEASWDANPV